jgi:hypothetical protein
MWFDRAGARRARIAFLAWMPMPLCIGCKAEPPWLAGQRAPADSAETRRLGAIEHLQFYGDVIRESTGTTSDAAQRLTGGRLPCPPA